MMQAEISRVDEVPAKPVLAPNVQLLGEMPDTGFIDRQWLIQRDGRFIQLTELLYRVAEQANGQHTLEEIACSVSDSTDWGVDAEDVRQLIASKLLPLRLMTPAASIGLASSHLRVDQETRSPLQLNLRMKVIGPRLIDPVTAILQYFFSPLVLIPVLIAGGVAHWWMYVIHGIGLSVRDALYTPGGLLPVLAIVLLGGAVHEFGHASALRYGGGKARGMGVGLYLIYPAFYTDVSDGYRLGRWARLRTDLGGVYFHLIFSSALVALSAITRWELLLFAALIINADMLRQFIPFARLDGYWILADLTGIPDFFSQMGAFVRSLQPLKGLEGNRLPPLKPWVRAIFAFYTLVTMPLLAFLFALMVVKLPALLTKTWDALLVQTEVFSRALADRAFPLLAMSAVQMLLLALPALGSLYLIYSVVRTPFRALWGWSARTPAGRIGRVLGAVACLVICALIWMPKLGLIPSRQARNRLSTRLEQVRQATSNIQALQADLEGSVGSAQFTGTVLLKRPNLARVNISGQQGMDAFAVASDGKDLWTYFPAENKLVRSLPGPTGANIQPFIVDEVTFFFRPETIGAAGKGSNASYVGKEMIDGVSYDVIEVRTSGSPKTTTVRYFISTTENIVTRVVSQAERDGVTSERWAALKNIHTDLSVDESAFHWAPPGTASVLQMPSGIVLPKK